MLAILPSWTEEAGYTPDPDVSCDGNVAGVTAAPSLSVPSEAWRPWCSGGIFCFLLLSLTTISTVPKLEFFQLWKFFICSLSYDLISFFIQNSSWIRISQSSMTLNFTFSFLYLLVLFI